MLEILKAGEVSAIDYKTGKVRVLFSAGLVLVRQSTAYFFRK